MLEKKINIGLFFGSFNPMHIGHLIIANHLVEYSNLNQVWFVVSPQNPFKEKKTLLDQNQRLQMVQLAIENYPNLFASNIEFSLPQPSYTSHTLSYLKEKHKDKTFHLIMGSDNLYSFHKWKNYQDILADHELFVYPRPGIEQKEVSADILAKTNFIEAPMIEISASFIRKSIKKGKNIKPLLPNAVFKYIDGSNLYKN